MWFEYGEDVGILVVDVCMKVGDCGVDCGWMVCEIVIDGYVVDVVVYFYVVFYVVE